MSTAYEGKVDTNLMAKAMLIRLVEQRLLDLFSEGKLFGTVHTCIGQEFTGIAVAETLRDGDIVFSNHRCHGHFLARIGDVEGLIAEVMGKETGVCGGRGGSQHLCAPGFFSNGVQGGIVPVSAGLALAQKYLNTGNIVACFIGDGTLGEGALYEAMNFASKWELPLLILLENNRYAQSTPQHQTLAGDISARAEAFGIAALHGNTWETAELMRLAREGVAQVRETGAPVFMCVDTYRLMAHSKGDDDRPRDEVAGYWKKDPLQVFINENPGEAARIRSEAEVRIDAAVANAERAAYAGPKAVDDEPPPFAEPVWIPTEFESTDRVVNRIHEALRAYLTNDDRCILIGEDIEGPYGGAFKVTKDLSSEFPGRVRNTPISEAAIVGIGNGLALGGAWPVCELMFGDFMALAADQLINHASKFRYMYNEQVDVPVIIRTPMGGKRGYGATHSQCIEKHFLGMPGTHMVAVHHRFDPARLYANMVTGLDRPTIVIENKLLYGARISDQPPQGFSLEHTGERYPTTRLRPAGKADVTLLCYGGLLPDVEEAALQLFDMDEITCDILCPTLIYPFNPWPIAQSVRITGRLVIVEEGQNYAAFGAEVIAALNELTPGWLKEARRVGPPRHPIPSAGPLEKALLPGTDHVVGAVRELVSS